MQIPVQEGFQEQLCAIPGTIFTPAPQTRLFLVDDQGIVFSQFQQKLFTLNTTACFIWICLEMEYPAERIAEEYRLAFSVDREEARDAVGRIIRQWLDLEMVVEAGGEPVRSLHTGVPEVQETRSCADPHEPQEVYAEVTYALLGSAVMVGYTSREQFLHAHPVLQHLQVDPSTQIPIHRILLLETGDQIHLLRDGRCEVVVDALDLLASRLQGLVVQTAVNDSDYLVYFHAGVVARQGVGFLLPATAGSGKSTLTAALVAHGYHYLSDEIALLRSKDLEVVPAPVSIGLKSGSWKVLESLYGEIPGLRIHDREDGRQVRYLPPPETSWVRGTAGFPVTTVIFPNYDPVSATTLQPVARVEALHRLFDDCQAIAVQLTQEHVEKLVDWIKSVDCYQLTMNSLEAAVTQVDRALGSG